MASRSLLSTFLALAASAAMPDGTARANDIVYRANPHVFEGSGIAAPGNQVPVRFSLSPVSGALVNETFVLSDPATVTGPEAGFALTARGGEIRVCSDAACAAGGAFASSVRASSGDFVQARLAGPATVGGVNRMTVESGSFTGTFEVTATNEAGLDPVADVVNAEPGSFHVSDVSALRGFASTTLSVTDGEYRLNGGAWLSGPAVAKAGDGVEVRLAAGISVERRTARVSVSGGSPLSFSVTARTVADTLPDAFSIAEVRDVAPSAVTVSGAITPTGYEGTVPVTATGGEVSVEGGPFAASGTIAPGQSFRVRTTSAATSGATVTATVTVGTGEPVAFKVTTQAGSAAPNPFAIASVRRVAPQTDAISDPVTVTGFRGTTGISASNGEVSVEGGPFAASGTIAANQSFRVRKTSSAEFGATVTATVSVGSGTPVPFDVTTRVDVRLAAQGLNARVGQTFRFDVATATSVHGGSREGLTFAATERPDWLTLSPDGIASGEPSNAGSSAFAVTATHPDGTGSRAYAVEVAAAEPIQATAVTVGNSSGCAVTTAGGVKCWGYNDKGALGRGFVDAKFYPYAGDVVGLSSGVSALSVRGEHTCVLTTAGGVKCWGSNTYGQLGDGTTRDSAVPVDVAGLSSGVLSISAGALSTCAVVSGGAVKCWGYNQFGQVGDGSTTSKSTPTQVTGLTSGVAQVSTGTKHACAVLSNGAAKCWGGNQEGQIGNGGTTNQTAPVTPTGQTTSIRTIAAGDFSTCVVTASGAVRCWGYNLFGGLGNGTTTNQTTATNVSGLSSGVTGIFVGGYHACAIASGGGVKCWGGNHQGQVGDGTTTNRTTPVDVPGISGASFTGGGSTSSCAVTTDATMCWGNNQAGQLGDGTRTTRSYPAAVTG